MQHGRLWTVQRSAPTTKPGAPLRSGLGRRPCTVPSNRQHASPRTHNPTMVPSAPAPVFRALPRPRTTHRNALAAIVHLHVLALAANDKDVTVGVNAHSSAEVVVGREEGEPLQERRRSNGGNSTSAMFRLPCPTNPLRPELGCCVTARSAKHWQGKHPRV